MNTQQLQQLQEQIRQMEEHMKKIQDKVIENGELQT